MGTYDTEEQAARAVDKCVAQRVLRRFLTHAFFVTLFRVIFLASGDASGVNLGPLTVEELERMRGVTLAQFVASAIAARAKFASGASSYRGVSWFEKNRKWKARIRNATTGKQEHIGCFDDETEAARAYDKCVCVAPFASLSL